VIISDTKTPYKLEKTKKENFVTKTKKRWWVGLEREGDNEGREFRKYTFCLKILVCSVRFWLFISHIFRDGENIVYEIGV
jgi:hypothetical protein